MSSDKKKRTGVASSHHLGGLVVVMSHHLGEVVVVMTHEPPPWKAAILLIFPFLFWSRKKNLSEDIILFSVIFVIYLMEKFGGDLKFRIGQIQVLNLFSLNFICYWLNGSRLYELKIFISLKS